MLPAHQAEARSSVLVAIIARSSVAIIWRSSVARAGECFGPPVDCQPRLRAVDPPNLHVAWEDDWGETWLVT